MARPTLADGQVFRILTERSTCPPSFSLSVLSEANLLSSLIRIGAPPRQTLITKAVSFLLPVSTQEHEAIFSTGAYT
jgi:hypothetical protein